MHIESTLVVAIAIQCIVSNANLQSNYNQGYRWIKDLLKGGLEYLKEGV